MGITCFTQLQPSTGCWSNRCINGASSSPFWKEMRTVKDIFFFAIAMEVKNGRAIRFWEDKWCSNVPLGTLFPELCSAAQDPTGSVSSHWSDNGSNIKLPYFIQGGHLRQRGKKMLKLLLAHLPVSVGVRDCII